MENAMNYKTTSAMTGLAERTLRNLVSKKGIPHYKLGKAVRFSPTKIKAWMDERSVEPLSKSLQRKEAK